MTPKILCDTDFLIALHLDKDTNHARALQIFNQYEEYFLLNLNLYETATVLSRLLSQEEAIYTLESIRQNFTNVLDFDRKWEEDIFDLYFQSNKKNISFVDLSCLFVAKKFNFKIASFDKFYPKTILATEKSA